MLSSAPSPSSSQPSHYSLHLHTGPSPILHRASSYKSFKTRPAGCLLWEAILNSLRKNSLDSRISVGASASPGGRPPQGRGSHRETSRALSMLDGQVTTRHCRPVAAEVQRQTLRVRASRGRPAHERFRVTRRGGPAVLRMPAASLRQSEGSAATALQQKVPAKYQYARARTSSSPHSPPEKASSKERKVQLSPGRVRALRRLLLSHTATALPPP